MPSLSDCMQEDCNTNGWVGKPIRHPPPTRVGKTSCEGKYRNQNPDRLVQHGSGILAAGRLPLRNPRYELHLWPNQRCLQDHSNPASALLHIHSSESVVAAIVLAVLHALLN